jgi:DNA-binding transcriptional MerR regulator
MTDNEDSTGYAQIGALAKATGLTVRTFHHYDAIGLLAPGERSYSGRRLYSTKNVRRLYQILALRGLGLSLDEIGAVLDRNPDLIEAVRGHLARVERGLELQHALHRKLARMLELLKHEDEPTLDQFIQAIEVMTMSEKYYSPEQLEQLDQRRRTLGEGRIREAEREWVGLIEAVRAERAAGTEPTDARMLALARQWRQLIEEFTGGDEGIRRSLGAMYRKEGVEEASRGAIDAELMSYVGVALAALPPSPRLDRELPGGDHRRA